MPISYRDLGGSKRISDIVFAGAHDASITFGKSHIQTQDLDIKGQAEAGVRIFDLRIMAREKSDAPLTLLGYHGKWGKEKTARMHSRRTGTTHNVIYSNKMKRGSIGMKLSAMLTQAGEFVTRTNEFLIFKFDKCSNYQLIAEYCMSMLGDAIYTSSVDAVFGKRTLDQLAGKVVCVFNESGIAEMDGLGPGDGILGFRNLKGDGEIKAYRTPYPGLQYFGKGGTNPYAVHKNNRAKLNENVSKQSQMMAMMAACQEQFAPDVLGMLYWTTTGTTSSIKKRNKMMWKDSRIARMQSLFENALVTSIEAQLELERVKYMTYGGVRRIKAFFPNIVMIDFANSTRCGEIYDLNTVAEDLLAEAFDEYCKVDD